MKWCIIFLVGVFSCTSGGKKTNWTEIYQDSAFLNIEGGRLENLFIEAKVDRSVYYRALQRMNRGLSIQNDTFCWNIENGAEVKISENIYDYITLQWRLDNEKLKSDTIYEIRISAEDSIYFVAPKNADLGDRNEF